MAESICEAILPGPWRLRPGITQAVIPPSELLLTGVCHIPIPEEMVRAYSGDGEAVQWLRSTREAWNIDLAETMELGEGAWVQPCFQPGNQSRSSLDWEENNWHYDGSEHFSGLSDSETYKIQSTIGPKERATRTLQAFILILAYPIDFQAQTVCVPWSGKYQGKQVQAPKGYATVFDPHAMWHRGDRWLGCRRGRLMQFIRIRSAD